MLLWPTSLSVIRTVPGVEENPKPLPHAVRCLSTKNGLYVIVADKPAGLAYLADLNGSIVHELDFRLISKTAHLYLPIGT